MRSIGFAAFFAVCSTILQAGTVTGPETVMRFHDFTLTCTHDENFSESGGTNPFTDRRLRVSFSGPGGNFLVYGYFAADGDAGNTHATEGNIWKVHFRPNMAGDWSYSVQFLQGSWVNIENGDAPGTADGAFDGQSGMFTVTETDKTGRDFRAHGMLRYVDDWYPQYHSGFTPWITGLDNPEELFGHQDFDNTVVNADNHFSAHVVDWQEGDPTWSGAEQKGKAMIGMLNWLESVHCNNFYGVSLNAPWGDGKNVFPTTEQMGVGNTPDRYDVSKLHQWQIFMDHAFNKGIIWNMVMSEKENKAAFEHAHGWSAECEFGTGHFCKYRRLFYVQLLARFSHYNVFWDLGEEMSWDGSGQETTPPDDVLKGYLAYLKEREPYGALLTSHNGPGLWQWHKTVFGEGENDLNMTAWQTDELDATMILDYREYLAGQGKKWCLRHDETSHVVMTGGYRVRHDYIWGNALGGGMGLEFYVGRDGSYNDLRDHEEIYRSAGNAVIFMNMIDQQLMEPRHDLLSSGFPGTKNYCMADVGSKYAIYVQDKGSVPTLDLSGVNGVLSVKWWDPADFQMNDCLHDGSVTSVYGGATADLGAPPAGFQDNDAVVLVGGADRDCFDMTGSGGSVAAGPLPVRQSDYAMFVNRGILTVVSRHDRAYTVEIRNVRNELVKSLPCRRAVERFDLKGLHAGIHAAVIDGRFLQRILVK